MRETCGGGKSVVAHKHLVRLLVAVAYAAKNESRHLHGRLIKLDELETAGQRRVLFKIFLVFLPCGRGTGAYLAAGQRRLHEVGGIRTAGLSARAHQHVGFVDEKNDGLLAGPDFIEHALETALELALHAGSGLKQSQIKRKQRHAVQNFRHVTFHNAQRKSFQNGRLAHARLAHQNRIVLAAAGKNVHHLPDFFVTPEHRVDFSRPGLGGKVFAVSGKEAFAGLTGHGSPAGCRLFGQRHGGFRGSLRQLAEVAKQVFAVDGRKRVGIVALRVHGGLAQKGQQHGPGTYLGQSEIHGAYEPRGLHEIDEKRRKYRAPGIAGTKIVQHGIQTAGNLRRIYAEALKRQRNIAAGIGKACEQIMLDGDLVVGAVDRLSRSGIERRR